MGDPSSGCRRSRHAAGRPELPRPAGKSPGLTTSIVYELKSVYHTAGRLSGKVSENGRKIVV